jgi:hypothetical protein
MYCIGTISIVCQIKEIRTITIGIYSHPIVKMTHPIRRRMIPIGIRTIPIR